MAQQEYKRGCQYAEVYRPSMFIRFQSIKTLVTILVSFVCISVVVLVPLFRPDEKFLTSKLDQQYFDDFVGASECKIHVHDLYSVALRDQAGFYDANTFCGKRSQLLTALSDGGRIGFDTPYIPKGISSQSHGLAHKDRLSLSMVQCQRDMFHYVSIRRFTFHGR